MRKKGKDPLLIRALNRAQRDASCKEHETWALNADRFHVHEGGHPPHTHANCPPSLRLMGPPLHKSGIKIEA